MRENELQTSKTIFTKSLQVCAYADDVVITSTSMKELSKAVRKLQKAVKKVGLEVNRK